MRHWLNTPDDTKAAGTLSMEREASPDGTARGQTTWFDYPGKSQNRDEGTNSFPSTIARVLPNGQTNYVYFERNSSSRPTKIVTSYGTGPTSRTNQLFYYSNG